jgi:PAS domain S-box-containing protein
MLACVAFMVWSGALVVSAQKLQQRQDANVQLLRAISGLQTTLHRLADISAPPPRWRQIESEYRQSRLDMERGPGNYELIRNLTVQINDSVDRMAALHARIEGPGVRPDVILDCANELAAQADTATALTNEAFGRLRREQESLGYALNARWAQMDVLVLICCALTAFLAVLLAQRRRAAQALRESVSMVKATLEAATDGILVLDLDSRIEGYNNRFLELWRISPSQAAEADAANIVAYAATQLADPEEFLRQVEKSDVNPALGTHDTLRFRDGRVFERDCRPRRVGDEIVGTVRSFRDITEREKASASLRLMESIVVNANDAVLLTTVSEANRHYTVVFANGSFTRETGFESAEILGKDARSLYSPDVDRSEVLRLGRLLAKKEPCRGELLLRCKDNREIWAEMSFVPVLDAAGMATHLIVIGRNVTERKKMEHELRKLSGAIEQCPVSVVITDLKGHIEYVNPKFTELTGYTLEEVRGQNPRVLKSGDTTPEEYVRLWETIRTGEWSGYFHNRKKNGELFWEAARICPIRDARGEPTHYLAVKEDITDRRRIEEALAQAKESAEAASRAKSEFLANMSHEIRTPMNGIIGFTQLTLQTELSTDQRDYLETVESSGHALLRIINDILDFSKIEAGRLEMERELFSLRETLAGAVNTVAPEAMSKGLDLSWGIDPGVPDALIGDSTRVRQVLLNLLGNAVKFTARGFIRAEVTAESLNDATAVLHFAVRDSGIGIAPAHHKAIFEPFQQADGSTTRKFGGTGLGLAISARLARYMRGRIWVESELGRGSTFHVTASFGVAAAPVEAGPADGAGADMDHPALTLLVVEDDAISRVLASKVLTNSGHKVVTAANGVEALWLIEQRPFDLVLMDVQMPQMDGLEATAKIRQREARMGGHVPIVAMTAHAMKGDRERCLTAGMDDYVSKPLDVTQLAAIVRKVAGVPETDGALSGEHT